MKNVVVLVKGDEQTKISFDKADEIAVQLLMQGLVNQDPKQNQADEVQLLISSDATKEAKSIVNRLASLGLTISEHPDLEWNKGSRGGLDSSEKINSLGIKPEDVDEYLSYVKLGDEFVAGIQSMIDSGKIAKKVKVGRHIGNIEADKK